MIKATTFSLSTLKNIALTGYFGLLFFMPLWLVVLNPSEGLSITLSLVFFTLPLLFPLKGLLQGNPFTYAWSNFIVMIYFLHSLTTLWVSADDTLWAIIELIFASLMFFGGTYYAKFKGQELGLSLRKKKDEEA
ncbi:DUF2069 domain-containing protein [Pseudocolwellia sp. AS88]|jgi:uncharacterized membrane protein|uniref:DUF2069 domain-containing protein n=1 Tax=Pseudocolwellia TaxID=2848177 RepID=UPI0026F10D52|nr:DUF2069 domain-containing protein [Pseudocolwellia sp. AS88]MDO7084642.1 DUF2069 domain-containing protein [Pseudocolwellia sp. AS88]